MGIDFSVMLGILLIILIHAVYVSLALHNLVKMKSMSGGKKAVWTLAIVFIICFGPIFFLLFNPIRSNDTNTQTETHQ